MSGTVWDWPNQQVVRADHSGPGVDTNTGEGTPEPAPLERAGPPDVASATKAQLLAYAVGQGLPVSNANTKDEIAEAVTAHLGG
jgi:hypothetical protein